MQDLLPVLALLISAFFSYGAAGTNGLAGRLGSAGWSPVAIRRDFTRQEMADRRGMGTLSYTRFEVTLQLAWVPVPDSRSTEANLEGTVSVRRQEVEIPSDYAMDSCEYRVLREHEWRHVEKNRQAMATLQRELADAKKTVRKLPAESLAESWQRLQVELDGPTRAHWMKRYAELSRTLNAPLDEVAVRAAEYRQCTDWVPLG